MKTRLRCRTCGSSVVFACYHETQLLVNCCKDNCLVGERRSNGSRSFTGNLPPTSMWELTPARFFPLMKFYFLVNTDLTEGHNARMRSCLSSPWLTVLTVRYLSLFLKRRAGIIVRVRVRKYSLISTCNCILHGPNALLHNIMI